MKAKKRKSKTENSQAIKSGNRPKNPWGKSKEVRETTVGRIYRKGKFWVWSGIEMHGESGGDGAQTLLS